MATDLDPLVTKYGYDPIVSGDGNGWTLGAATKVERQLGSGWSDSLTRYDNSGRVVETRQPGGSADGTGAGGDAHSTVTTYYTASGSGDCGGKPVWDGLVCKVGPAAQPAGTTMPIAYTSAYDDSLQPTVVQEISGGAITRTTTTTYDNIGRITGVTKATSGSGVTNETIATTYGYDDNTGMRVSTISGSKSITTTYDAWGRTTGYSDALGTSSATTYDAAGNVATFNDGSSTYTYTYGGHNDLSSVGAGGGVGAFGYAYTADGHLDSVTYPNGVVAKRSYDQAGDQTGLTYSQGSTQVLGFSATIDAGGRTVGRTSVASAQLFTYDDLGRLNKTEDTRSGGCITRAYGFDASSNRSSFASYTPGTAGACQITTAADSKANSYDAAGRISNVGYAYDILGRTLATPQGDAGPNAAGNLAATYHADDMVASLSQSVLNGAGGQDAKVMTYALDPDERINAVTTSTNGAESTRLRYRFTADTDSPSMVDQSVDSGSTWSSSRYVRIPGVGLAASSSGGVTTDQLANLHGDVVATMANTSGTNTIATYSETDEYGNGSVAGRYGWLGANQRSTDALGGMMLMGARLYNAETGLFLSADAVMGGNVTTYTYPLDPIGMTDTTGAYRETYEVHTFWTGMFTRVDTGHAIMWLNRAESKSIMDIDAAIFTLASTVMPWIKVSSLVNKLMAVAGAGGYLAAFNKGFRLAIRYWSSKPRMSWQDKMDINWIYKHAIGRPVIFVYRLW